ncbi:unannotated protein [freshwater metagenome]|uniref:Unannotated protein n=1 Tax=freshwater metagenome TaxID=449393 RepID=A0A6J6UBZ8_9ZZZZ
MLAHTPVVPKLSFFYGISIYMYPRDHNPPHFHAIYGEFSAQVLISNGLLVNGSLPRRAERLVREWLHAHQNEIYQAWINLQGGKSVEAIEPLR